MLTSHLEPRSTWGLASELNQTWNDNLKTVLLERPRFVAHQISECTHHILSISHWCWAILDFISFRLQYHKQDAWLDTVASTYKLVFPKVDHKSAEKDENGFSDSNWNDLILCIVSVEMHGRKYLIQYLLHKFIREDSDSFEEGWSNLKSNSFHSYLSAQQVKNDFTNLAALFLHVTWELANHSNQELTQGWN